MDKEIITGQTARNLEFVDAINQKIIEFAKKIPEIACVCFDYFPNPPGLGYSEGTYIFITKEFMSFVESEFILEKIIDLDWRFAQGEIIENERLCLDLELLPFGYLHKNEFVNCIYDRKDYRTLLEQKHL